MSDASTTNRGDSEWVRSELKSKANIDWVVSELGSIRVILKEKSRRLDEMSRVLSLASSHSCSKEEDLRDLKKWRSQAFTLKLAAIGGFVALLAGGMAQYFSLTNSVSNAQADVVDLKTDINQLTEGQKNLERTLERQTIESAKMQKMQWTEVREILSEISDAKSKRKRR